MAEQDAVGGASGRLRPWVVGLVVGGLWSALVLVAFGVTWRSLQTESFDGLNNIAQFPLAAPWFALLLLVPPLSHEATAWAMAAMGLVNGVLLGVGTAAVASRLYDGRS